MSGNLGYFLFSFIGLILVFAVLNLIILHLIKKNIKWPYIIISGTVYAFVVFGLSVLAGSGFDFGAAIQSVKEEAAIELSAVMEMSKAGGEEADKEQIKKMAEFFVIDLYPGRVLVQILFIVFLNYFVVRLFMMKNKKTESVFPDFHMWYAGEKVSWLLIAGLALFLAGDRLFDSRLLELVGANIMFVLGVFYFIIGFAITRFYLLKYRVNFFVQLIIYFVIVMWFMGIMLLTGILDTWFNFRKIEKGGSIWK